MPQEIDFGETYVIIEKIGAGGGGTVYKAYHKRLKKEVALKKIHSDLQNINARTETDILKNLKHSYLPQVYDFIENKDGIYTVMEYIEGRSLREYLETGSRFKERDIIKWFRQLCEALEVLHSKTPPIIHGDIKPDNIMVTPDGNICLIDFNIASIFEGSKTIVSGYTPGYAAPEQIKYFHTLLNGNKIKIKEDSNTERTEFLITEKGPEKTPDILKQVVDRRTDIFSLGATIYHLCTGKKPRTDGGIIPNIRTVFPDISEPLAHIIEKCMQEDPNLRYQNITDVKEALSNIYLSSDRYKKLIIRQKAGRVFLFLGLVGFSVMAAYGYRLMGQERIVKYEEVISIEKRAVESEDVSAMEKAYKEAVNLVPGYSDAYEIKAHYLYNRMKYSDMQLFLINDAIPYVNEGIGKANLYYLLSDSLMKQEDYEDAALYLEKAISCDDENADIYSAYAVCFAKQKNVEKAQEQLDEAIEKGLDEDSIFYTSGEIAYAKGNHDEAESNFRSSIEISDENDLKLRAYLMLMEILEQDGSVAALRRKIDYANEAERQLEDFQKMAIWQEKAQAQIDLGNLLDDISYDMEAIKTLYCIIDYGYGDFNAYQNIVILYQKNGKYSEEEKLLKEMEEVFGEDYRIYKYLAYMEVSKQRELDETNRDYGLFRKYYLSAKDLYEGLSKNETDPDIKNLEELYNQAKTGGWID